ncbi:MAG: acetyl-CoA carboxylase biotin carboxylase subunit [Planctomycetota bacterium]|nr:acetyl-CoA carboxylase biotin carboxylase subunit [Planctomycetota bacterium]
MIRKLLVANRGEIALRIVRTARELGLQTVAVHADQDRGAPFVFAADESVPLRGRRPEETYLDVEKILQAARSTAADAIHPGYGFLAENADFARASRDAGLCFVGPPSDVLRLAGNKLEARRRVEQAGVPVLPCYRGPLASFTREAPRLGLPLLVKAAAGGGGRGMRHVDVGDVKRIEALARAASREAESAFADGEVYLERLVPRARHVEFQVLADREGRIVQLGERDCSIQRRHQKLVEESPSPLLDRQLRRRMAEAAVEAARAVAYEGAGTVEFLLDLDPEGKPRDFFFLEINARIQVEHPVTELRTGEDLVAWQLRIASGEPLPERLARVEGVGHAIECRIAAEKPPEFLPSSGTLRRLVPPGGPGVRWDGGYAEGDVVPGEFDSLLGKVIVHAADRPRAIRRMLSALREAEFLGVHTNQDFLAAVLEHPHFRSGRFTTSFVGEEMSSWEAKAPDDDLRWLARQVTERAAADGTGRTEPARRRGPWELLTDWNRARGGGAS